MKLSSARLADLCRELMSENEELRRQISASNRLNRQLREALEQLRAHIAGKKNAPQKAQLMK